MGGRSPITEIAIGFKDCLKTIKTRPNRRGSHEEKRGLALSQINVPDSACNLRVFTTYWSIDVDEQENGWLRPETTISLSRRGTATIEVVIIRRREVKAGESKIEGVADRLSWDKIRKGYKPKIIQDVNKDWVPITFT